MKNAVASNWVAETCVATDAGFTLKGTSKGYTSFSGAFSAGDQVFYSVHDSNGNREAGYATFDGTALIDRAPTATLFNNVYSKSSVSKLDFSGELTIACTFNAVAFNILWKALDAIDPDGDGNINIPPELIDGLIDRLDTKAEQADLEQEIQDRIDGDKALQDKIDAIDPDGDRKVDWNEIEGKPSEFPPADHNHDGDYLKTETDPTVPDHVKSITTDDIDNWNASSGAASTWDELTGKPTEFPPEAHNQDWSTITNTPSEYPPEDHTHAQSEVDGLELRLEAIEDSITGGGGFADAPNDGQLYGRQSEAWAVVPTSGAPAWDDVTGKPTEFPPEAHQHGWDQITGKPADFPPSAHTHEIDDVDGLQDALDAAGGTGSSVHIGEAPPDSPEEGQQWMEVPASGDAVMWIYDGAVWLEQPGGKDGADGADGLWTDNGDTTISYTDGRVGIGIDSPARILHVQNDGLADLLLRDTSSYSLGNGPAVIFEGQDSRGANTQFGAVYGVSNGSNSGELQFETRNAGSSSVKMKIAADGNVGIGINDPQEALHVKGRIITDGLFRDLPDTGGIGIGNHNDGPEIVPIGADGLRNDNVMNLGRRNVYRFKNGFFAGTVTLRSGVAVGTRDIIDTLSTLRNATKDETTVKGLRDAIGNAVGGLIEKFEAMQEESGNE